jgi:Tfp pilus assembly pilus retraction ATPase PilT
MIEQKEINTHTKDTSKAIQSIIKEDPDIIVIDKLTDSIVAKYVIDLINRGYFIILTMNASNTQDTISKFLEFFESDIQEHIRHTLAYKLRAIISQELIINKDNNLIPVVEVMYQTENITNAILNQLDEQITDIIKQDSKTYDSITFEQSFQKLYTAGQVKKEALCSNLLKEEKRKATAKKSDNIVMIDDSTTITYSIRDEE